jgi:hypothetical protein
MMYIWVSTVNYSFCCVHHTYHLSCFVDYSVLRVLYSIGSGQGYVFYISGFSVEALLLCVGKLKWFR